MASSIWDGVPVIEIPLPTCPTCGVVGVRKNYIPVRGKRDEDGGRTSWRVCAVCSGKYIVLTVPQCGEDDSDVG